jgi:ATP-dependent exoDNAse (exonuclease V) alpha subunit
MIVKRVTQRVLEVEILGGKHNGETAFIPCITLHSSAWSAFRFQLKRRQFPIRLAFSMTINKAQGQSVRHVGLDLREPVFSHGQLYVALSRATSSQRIKILLPQEASECRIRNVVYPEVFQLL